MREGEKRKWREKGVRYKIRIERRGEKRRRREDDRGKERKELVVKYR